MASSVVSEPNKVQVLYTHRFQRTFKLKKSTVCLSDRHAIARASVLHHVLSDVDPDDSASVPVGQVAGVASGAAADDEYPVLLVDLAELSEAELRASAFLYCTFLHARAYT